MPDKTSSTNPSAIIISISSDIGFAMAQRWRAANHHISGTYRSNSDNIDLLRQMGAHLVACDLNNNESVDSVCGFFSAQNKPWDVLALCPGTLNPVGPFAEANFNDWEQSIKVNFVNQLRFVRNLLPSRNTATPHGPCVLFFAGGGTNSATVNYSAYTISKIALIKMCELLDAEISDTKFVIVGPGWVKTKIHQETIQAGSRAGDNYPKTLEKLAGDAFTPMGKVLDCCDWLVRAPREAVSGRNFSVAFDPWGSDQLIEDLRNNSNQYKLRRNEIDVLAAMKGAT